ncbi:galactose-binding domain-like protein [Pavlovales sp. CCMP2436]|nr:galactose-binding domain-like protein [Pavlovales sp. CCMP2436]
MSVPSEDLLEHIELPQCECLNAAKDHTLRHCLEQPTLFLQSDCDEELLITLMFRTPVRISAIRVEGPGDKGPSSIRLFVNKLGLDFDSAKSEAPTQELALSAAGVAEGAKPVELRYVLFQVVSQITLFFPGNLGGGEETVIQRLQLLGTAIQHEGAKRSKEEQAAASKGDWLGSGTAGA